MSEKMKDLKKKKSYDSFSFMGWVLGGLSLLNLIEDLSPITLFGKLAKWVDAYNLLAQRVIEFLFGWIDYKWINISNLESHVLVLMFVILSARVRVDYQFERKKGKPIIFVSLVVGFLAFLHFLHALLPALLFPSWYGFLGALAGMCFTSYAVLTDNIERDKTPSAVAVRNEIKGSIIFFILLIVVNYTIFK